MTVRLAVRLVIRRGPERLLLFRGEEGEDLRVGRLMLLICFGATGRLRRGELRDLGHLVVRQLHRIDELHRHFEAMDETRGIRATGGRRRVHCRHGRRGARGPGGLGVGRGNWSSGGGRRSHGGKLRPIASP